LLVSSFKYEGNDKNKKNDLPKVKLVGSSSRITVDGKDLHFAEFRPCMSCCQHIENVLFLWFACLKSEFICNQQASVLVCEYCEASYHPHCLQGGLLQTTTGWFCSPQVSYNSHLIGY
jgi:hypothetical protein